MNAIPLLVMLSTVGIDFGWEPVAGGGIHYIVQIDPRMLDTMKEGTVVSSDLPEVPGGIRRYRIVVGTGPLPHQGEPLPQAPPPQTPTPATTSSGPTTPSVATPPPAVTTSSATTASPTVASPPSTTPSLSTPSPEAHPALSPSTATHDAPTAPQAPPTQAPPTQPLPTTTHTFGPDTHFGPKLPDPSTTTAQPMTTPKPAIDAQALTEATDDGKRPWMPLTLTLLGLFASLGGNVFLGMVAYSQRSRFDELASRLKEESI
ncbi:MAG TPA: hypothetical protein VHV77_05865 [Pirellulales bacterium]|jgi:hypothetical protein|nr:hypothetical protein [Pirellulales bacterium]